jgi:AcrR family transcriptional regulator
MAIQKKPSSARPKPAAAVGRPRGSNKEDTLARLLPAARQLFAEKGYAQTTFKDVGGAIGISHAALYSYFPAKLDLYVATLADTQALLLPGYLAAIASGDSLRERIVGVLLASADAHDRDSSITGLLAAVPIEIRRHPELNAALNGQNNEVMDALKAIFAEAKKTGEIRSDASLDNLVTAFLGGGVGVALFQYGLQNSGSLREAMDVYVAMIEGLIFSVK